MQNIIHLDFLLFFTSYLLVVFCIIKILNKIFFNSKAYFKILYFSIIVHETCHYIAAIFTLHLPKFNKIEIKKINWVNKIKWSVTFTNYSYKTLFYHILNKEIIINSILLIWQIVSNFIIWLAPIIFPFLFTYLYFDLKSWLNLEIFSYQDLILIPIYFLFSMVSNLSWSDIKNALPWIFLISFINLPENLIENLKLNLFLMTWVLFISVLTFLSLRFKNLFRKFFR